MTKSRYRPIAVHIKMLIICFNTFNSYEKIVRLYLLNRKIEITIHSKIVFSGTKLH